MTLRRGEGRYTEKSRRGGLLINFPNWIGTRTDVQYGAVYRVHGFARVRGGLSGRFGARMCKVGQGFGRGVQPWVAVGFGEWVRGR